MGSVFENCKLSSYPIIRVAKLRNCFIGRNRNLSLAADILNGYISLLVWFVPGCYPWGGGGVNEASN